MVTLGWVNVRAEDVPRDAGHALNIKDAEWRNPLPLLDRLRCNAETAGKRTFAACCGDCGLKAWIVLSVHAYNSSFQVRMVDVVVGVFKGDLR